MARHSTISKGIDWAVVWLYIFLVILGLLCIFSVEYRSTDKVLQTMLSLKKNYSRQLLFIGISAVITIIILLTYSKFFTANANVIYALGILLMMATFVVGKD